MSKNQDSKINKESSTQKLEPEKLENVNGGAKNIKHILVAYGITNNFKPMVKKYGIPPGINPTKPQTITVAYGGPDPNLPNVLPTTKVEEKEQEKSEDNPLNPIVNPTSK